MSEGDVFTGLGPRIDLVLRFDKDRPHPDRFDPGRDATRPASAGQIVDLIRRGNCNYAGFIHSCHQAAGLPFAPPECVVPGEVHRVFLGTQEVGLDGEAQEPYAAIIGCIDSRVPAELVLGQAANDVFAIRTAGNTLTALGEGRGSLYYILQNYAAGSGGAHADLRVVLVLGHSRCGAVEAAYNAFKPKPSLDVNTLHRSLRDILLQIKPAVDLVLRRVAEGTDRYSNETALKDAISYVNAFTSHVKVLATVEELGLSSTVSVYYGVYHIEDYLLRNSNMPGFRDEGIARYMTEVLATRGSKALSEEASWGDDLEGAVMEAAKSFAAGRLEAKP